MHRRDFLRYMAALGLVSGAGRLVLPEERTVHLLDSGDIAAFHIDQDVVRTSPEMWTDDAI